MTGKIVVTGAAGLMGQNLVPRLKSNGYTNIVAIDKHPTNMEVLKRFHPDVTALHVDLATDTGWEQELAGCEALVIGHAQIGGPNAAEFVRNNVDATRRLLDAAVQYKVPYLVNISSSVVNSMAIDNYTETKKAQEALVLSSGIPQVVLRPTLMFGWFDRKHLGWLARFMQRVPVFPIPGSGKYLRQPLYAGDFCDIIMSSVARRTTGTYDISGQERIDYIDLIRAVKRATGAKARIQTIPYGIFWAMLRVNAIFDKDPAFTVTQLKALVTPDIFDVIDWPGIFGVHSTPLQHALDTTYCDPTYSQIVLDF
jgi:nucleoside-diphosphate-sugar epimerase